MNIVRDLRTFFPKIRKQFVRKRSTNYVNNLDDMEGIKTMKDLGYTFNSKGQVRKIGVDGKTTDEPFHFNISSDHQHCQAHYEELGTAVTYYVYNLLEKDLGLHKLLVPKNYANGTFIFASKDYEKKDVLLVLIHGCGVVRAGQWARSLIINENIEMGSQISYIKKALEKDYGVLVLNTNDNSTKDGNTIPHSSTPEEHALYVWKTYISKANATSVVIVAHSYGGVVTVSLADEVRKEFEERVKAIALTDSVHSYSNMKITPFIKEVAMNWISSQSPLDTPMKTPDFDIMRLSAGHERHEMTSHVCIESVFKFIDMKLKK